MFRQGLSAPRLRYPALARTARIQGTVLLHAIIGKEGNIENLQFRVGPKGGVSVYGLNRFPITLYFEQWIRLLDTAEGLRVFLEDNKPKLRLKDR